MAKTMHDYSSSRHCCTFSFTYVADKLTWWPTKS